MQIDDMLLLRMNRQYLFTPAEDEPAVLRGLCGLQAQFYGNCLGLLFCEISAKIPIWYKKLLFRGAFFL